MKQMEFLKENNVTTEDLLDIIKAQNFLIAEQEKEINTLKHPIYVQPVFQDGVMVKTGRIRTTGEPNSGFTGEIKWYADKLKAKN